ncbi:MAG: transglutaminase domain-containing protein [Chitinophagaceae bacterium]|nr:transglutaminase domain-containing protein [Chitinophagaceae bacterium]
MFRSGTSFFLSLLFASCLFAQDSDDNITIESALETYRFAAGDAAHPVVVKQTLIASYLCNKYRAVIPVAEFYNDQVQLNDVSVKVNDSRLKNFKPVHEYYSSDGIFYSDARVCYFSLPFEKKGARGEVSFQKTALDPRYFTSIYFTEPFFLKKKEVQVVVPRWMKVELKEFNFHGYSIARQIKTEGDMDIHTYTIENAKALKSEKQSPGMSRLAPHLLILTKQATPPAGSQITYFNTLADQYSWYRSLVKQIGNDAASVKNKALELTKGLNGDEEKVKALYLWAQENIRYIAYEDGIAGFKPEKAQEVLAKKYGDCKGMANLMAEMLKAIGLDGRLAWLGTNHIAYDYSTPSLAVDNHMICAWMHKGQVYYLDATEKYIGFNEIAERIQGRPIMIEDGEKYLLKNIPVANPEQNTSLEKRYLAIDGNDLKGKVAQIWKGESKEWLLSMLHSAQKDKLEEVLKRFLAAGNINYQISNLRIFNLQDYNSDFRIEYDLLFKNAIVSVGNEMFLEMDNRKDFSKMSFDTTERKLPYQFNFKAHMVFETELDIPVNAKPASLPSHFTIDHHAYSMKGEYKVSESHIFYKREILLKNTLLPTEQIPEWNASIGKLNEFYNNQLALSH